MKIAKLRIENFTTRIILHIDMDAFFAAIEERDRPRLRGQPIVVGADPRGGAGRGVVSTANYVARKYGIHSAMPISKAWQLSEAAGKKGEPRAVFLEGSFKKYSEESRKIMEYLRAKAEKVEQASVDEAYLELEFPISNYQFPKSEWEYSEKVAREIKSYIKKNHKLTCSVGIGPNKLIAKIASDRQKPDGLTMIKPEEVQNFLDPLSIRVIPRIGPKAEEIFNRLNIKRISELRAMPENKLKEIFGKWGIEMYRKTRGIDESPVSEEHETKSIGEQETYEQDTLDGVFLVERLKRLAKGVFESLRRERFKFRTISITVRFHDFETKTRAHTLTEPAADLKILESEALKLFLPFLDSRENPRRKLIRLLGVRVEKLVIRN